MAEVNKTVAFKLGVLGTIATDRFAAGLETLDLKPKHVGLMLVLAGGLASSQLDVARIMGVAPSLVVAFADHLEELGAIQRDRDPADRRRQVLTLTAQGRDLLAHSASIASALDAALTAPLSEAETAALHTALARLLTAQGLPFNE